MYDDYFKNIMGGNIKSPEYYVSTYDDRTYEPRQVNALSGYDYSSSNSLNEYNDLDEDRILELYPDIYRIVMPMVDKLLSGRTIDNVNENIIMNWTVEIYDALEVDDNTKLVNTNITKKGNNIINNGTSSTSRSNLNQGIIGNSTSDSMRNQGITDNTNISIRSGNTNSSIRTNSSQGVLGNTNSIRLNSSQGIAGNTNNTTVKPNSNFESETTSVRVTVKSPMLNSMPDTESKVIDVATRYRNYSNPLLRDLIRILILNRLFGNRRPPRPRPYQGFETRFMPMPNYSNVNTEVYKPYTDYSKTYFDTPYPEE